MKKGQLTVFVIIAIVIIFTAVLFFVFHNRGSGFSKKTPGLQNLEEEIESCLNQRLLDSMWLVGIHGGFVDFVEGEYEQTSFGPVMYGLKSKRDVLLTKEEIEERIEDYIEYSLLYCLDSKNYDFVFEEGDVEADVRINEDNVEVIAVMPVYLTNSSVNIKSEKEYRASVPVRLGRIVELSHEIIAKQKNSGEEIPITYLSDFEVDILFDYYDEDTLMYMIYDNESRVNDIPYSFLFLAELDDGGEA